MCGRGEEWSEHRLCVCTCESGVCVCVCVCVGGGRSGVNTGCVCV